MAWNDALFPFALHWKVNPALERFLENPDYSRFERDEPPRFIPSPENHSIWQVPGMIPGTPDTPEDGSYQREMEELFDPPLNPKERNDTFMSIQGERMHHPGSRYELEEKFEVDRMVRSLDHRRHRYNSAESGMQRLRVLARRNVRKRWEKMGVWNPAWGIPCREPKEPNDNTYYWRWEWQHDELAARAPSLSSASVETHPIARAFIPREGLEFGQCLYPPPHSHPTEQTSRSEAMSFIASRPWFLIGMERMEWLSRSDRLPRARDTRFVKAVPWLWQKRGDRRLKTDSSEFKIPIGWKWRYESPSPDHEDATWKWLPDSGPAFEGVVAERHIHLDYDAMELTPSEIDVLESLAYRPLSPAPQRADGPNELQKTWSLFSPFKGPFKGLFQNRAPEPEPPAQPRRSPRVLAKAAGAMPPIAPTETGNPSCTTRTPLSEKISVAESTSGVQKPDTETDTKSTEPRHRPPATVNTAQSPRGVCEPPTEPPAKIDTPAAKRGRGRPSKKGDAAQSPPGVSKPPGTEPPTECDTPAAKRRGRPSKAATQTQDQSRPAVRKTRGRPPAETDQPVAKRGRPPKATGLATSLSNTHAPVAAPRKTQAETRGLPRKTASQALPQSDARKTSTKAEKSTAKKRGPSGVSKPAARSKKGQAKGKENLLSVLLTDDKQPPAKTARRKAAGARDKLGDAVQAKKPPPETEIRSPQKRKRGQHKKSDAQESGETIVVQLNDSTEALDKDQTAPLVGLRRSERVKDRERKKQKTS
ncbi:unnamed protein product [Clonostachys rosea]|uniref:Rrn9 domain-containing protein n=1 Tax=Bionectria ochroleuca TaxID=29856 RepID=A0ABY6UJ29_BIOOC|nr:unnamed protein product [Clonostachys rosea]